MRFHFSTKADTLQMLKESIKSAIILEGYAFTVAEFETDPERILDTIRKRFSKRVIVRSSAIAEDSYEESMAGKFASVLDVDPRDDSAMISAVERVIASYGATDGRNQVLIQAQLCDVQMSGVVFTQDLETGAPYYLVHYDDYSGKTDIITSGIGEKQKIFTYCKVYTQRPTDKRLAMIIDAVRELERITEHDALDIEFAIADEMLHILQVRPITTKTRIGNDTHELIENLEQIKHFIRSHNTRFPNLVGNHVGFGVMPDWNPAEIIGLEPKPLAFSLYRHIITNEVWPLARRQLGYKDIGYQPGIVSFAGKPYVDIRMSFNTFLPAGMMDATGEKLVDFYMQKLRRYQDLHDKVEFQIVYTCYEFDEERMVEELGANGFFSREIEEISRALHRLTADILHERVTTIDDELAHTITLATRRRNIVNSDIPITMKIAQLSHDCKVYGTLPFSKLARLAFIGNALMRSLVRKGIITQDQYFAFFGSIHTVATDFLYALEELKTEEITRAQFLNEYGHLRPGTYDICSRTYREAFDEYIDLANFVPPERPPRHAFTRETMEAITAELHARGFSLDAAGFLSFVKRATVARERAKFEFTKNLNLILEYIIIFFTPHGFAREDLAFLTIDDVLRLPATAFWHDTVHLLRTEIESNKRRHRITRAIKLPPVIFMEKSVEYFRSTDTMPNFITAKSVCAPVHAIGDSTLQPHGDLKGKIVLIENADPGYDWIFSHEIAGLITAFGGAGSHMAIRAAEFQLPAAIGCGATLFHFIKGLKSVELDCATKQIKPII